MSRCGWNKPSRLSDREGPLTLSGIYVTELTLGDAFNIAPPPPKKGHNLHPLEGSFPVAIIMSRCGLKVRVLSRKCNPPLPPHTRKTLEIETCSFETPWHTNPIASLNSAGSTNHPGRLARACSYQQRRPETTVESNASILWRRQLPHAPIRPILLAPPTDC